MSLLSNLNRWVNTGDIQVEINNKECVKKKRNVIGWINIDNGIDIKMGNVRTKQSHHVIWNGPKFFDAQLPMQVVGC